MSSVWQDHLLTAMIGLVTVALFLVFGWIIGDLLLKGASHLSWQFFIAEPESAGREGGIAPIIVSTVLILAVALVVALPLGLASAVWLAEYRQGSQRFGQLIRLSLDTLAGVPSIVWGLFGNAFFCVFLGLGFSILSGGKDGLNAEKCKVLKGRTVTLFPDLNGFELWSEKAKEFNFSVSDLLERKATPADKGHG